MTTKVKTSSWVIFTIATCYFMTIGSNLWESLLSAFAWVAVIKGILYMGDDILTQLSSAGRWPTGSVRSSEDTEGD